MIPASHRLSLLFVRKWPVQCALNSIRTPFIYASGRGEKTRLISVCLNKISTVSPNESCLRRGLTDCAQIAWLIPSHSQQIWDSQFENRLNGVGVSKLKGKSFFGNLEAPARLEEKRFYDGGLQSIGSFRRLSKASPLFCVGSIYVAASACRPIAPVWIGSTSGMFWTLNLVPTSFGHRSDTFRLLLFVWKYDQPSG